MQPTPTHVHILLAAAMLAVGVAACGGQDKPGELLPGELARVGNNVLLAEEVREAMPYGLTGNDSLRWWRSYVADWIERKAVGIEAARNIATSRRVERMVDEYRNDLLMWEYVRAMAGQQPLADYPDDTLQREYERTPQLYRCSQPMVRGVFISVDRKHPRLRDMRRWCRSTNAADLERLEKLSLDPDVEYIYFRDQWMPWSDMAARVPGGVSQAKAADQRAGFDTTVGDRVYMLVVADYLSPGELMPFEMAREAVVAMLRAASAADYAAGLRRDLVDRAYANGLVAVAPEMADSSLTAPTEATD